MNKTNSAPLRELIEELRKAETSNNDMTWLSEEEADTAASELREAARRKTEKRGRRFNSRTFIQTQHTGVTVEVDEESGEALCLDLNVAIQTPNWTPTRARIFARQILEAADAYENDRPYFASTYFIDSDPESAS